MAIDISEGRVVRLVRGDPSATTVYSEDPVGTALSWQEAGAEWLHVVDLDAAFGRQSANSEAVKEIVRRVELPVQVSGGIRTLESIESWLENGAARVCVGTRMLDPSFASDAASRFGDSLVAAVDAASGEVRVEGWTAGSGIKAPELARRLARTGVRRLLFTDIERDGTLAGLDISSLETFLESVDLPVIAGGGIRDAGSIRAAAHLGVKGLEGVVVGKALYSGSLDLAEARAAGEI